MGKDSVTTKASRADRGPEPSAWLPDLCTPASTFLLVLLGMVVALIYALASSQEPGFFLFGFGLSLLFVEWIVLVSAALLCLLRRVAGSWPDTALGGLVIAVIPLVTAAASSIVMAFVPIAESTHPLWFLTRNVLISLLASLMLVRYLVLQQRWRRQVEAESRARLDALQASIQPHFLFNALNTIASLVHDKPDAAEQATLDLSDLLRTGMRSGRTQSLEEELELVRGYLRLEGLRLGDRLSVDWQLADDLPLERELPALLIQPLVENAIIHGIARLPAGGVLTIRIERAAWGRVRIEIINPVPEEDRPATSNNRTALVNIRQRLALAYDDRARLKTQRQDGHFRVELIVPS